MRAKRNSVRCTGNWSRPTPHCPRVIARWPRTRKLADKYFPGVPVVPVLQAGATDGAFFNAIGIPTYGIAPVFIGPDLGHVHGLNEYVNVESVLTGRDFLHELIQIYANQK